MTLGLAVKRLTGVLLVFLVLILSTLATDLGRDQAIHADASSSQHQCAITLFAHGQILHSPAVPVLVIAPATTVVRNVAPQAPSVPSRRHVLPPGRAPPA